MAFTRTLLSSNLSMASSGLEGKSSISQSESVHYHSDFQDRPAQDLVISVSSLYLPYLALIMAPNARYGLAVASEVLISKCFTLPSDSLTTRIHASLLSKPQHLYFPAQEWVEFFCKNWK